MVYALNLSEVEVLYGIFFVRTSYNVVSSRHDGFSLASQRMALIGNKEVILEFILIIYFFSWFSSIQLKDNFTSQ